MQHTPYSRKLRQLDARIREWNQCVQSGIPASQLTHLVQSIRSLIRILRGAISESTLKTRLATLLMAGGIVSHATAQNFAPPVENPFGFVVDTTNYVGGICTADLDGDGDLDLLYGGYYGTIDFMENTGTAQNPVFDSPQTNPFGLTSTFLYAFITAKDLDNDGDLDIVGGEYGGNHIYYQNIGTASAPLFSLPMTNAFGLEQGSYISMPEFADMDNDGDYDIISGEAGGLIYFQNQGTANIPAFGAAVSNPFLLVPNPVYFSHPTMGDLDGDGDLDMLIGETGGNLRYIQNLGNANAALFDMGQLNPFGIVGGAAPVILPEFVDIDNDGDLDILASGYEGTLWFYENLEVTVGLDEQSQMFHVNPNPFLEGIEISSTVSIKELRIVDIRGKVVHCAYHPDSNIQLGHLSSGIYTVLLLDENQVLYRQRLEKR